MVTGRVQGSPPARASDAVTPLLAWPGPGRRRPLAAARSYRGESSCFSLAPTQPRDPAKPRFDRSLTRPVPQLVGARRLRTLILSDVDYLKGADARSPTAATPDATARHRPLRLPVMGLPPRYTVANRPLRPTFSNLDSALCTHVPPNMPPAFPPSHLAPRTSCSLIFLRGT